MRRRITLPLATIATTVATLALIAPAAQAHGYISTPPSRQALCASGAVTGCGDLQYEPQSVEAPKGSKLCSGGNTRFTVLDDTSRNWLATSVGSSATFNWALTARHSTSSWQYFIGGTQIASFSDGGAIPGATVSHTVNFGGFTGRQTVLAVWNIADTPSAFYACVDVQIGAGGVTTPTGAAPTATSPARTSPTTTSPTASSPTGTRPTATSPAPTATSPTATTPSGTTPSGTAPTTTSPPSSTSPTTSSPSTAPGHPGKAKKWRAGKSYLIGAEVRYHGLKYTCRQSHTAFPGWEPPNVLALWLPVR